MTMVTAAVTSRTWSHAAASALAGKRAGRGCWLPAEEPWGQDGCLQEVLYVEDPVWGLHWRGLD